MFLKFKVMNGTVAHQFVDPDTGYVFLADSEGALFNAVRKYRENNKLKPIDMLKAVIQNYQCNQPGNAGRCEGNDVIHRGWRETVRGGISVLMGAVFKNQVSDEEANRRAALCVKCPHNVFPDKGRYIKWADELAEKLTGGRKAKLHDELGSCAVCTCPLRSRIFNADKKPLTQNQLDRMPDFCWQKEKDK